MKISVAQQWLKDLFDGYNRVHHWLNSTAEFRMKCVGMRWSRCGGQAMLEVSCALLSDCWEDLMRICA